VYPACLNLPGSALAKRVKGRLYGIHGERGKQLERGYLEVALRERLPLASLDKELVRAAERTGLMMFQP
jgi:hypothetical protein